MIENHYKLVLETALLCSAEPLTLNELGRLYGEEVTPENIIVWLNELQNDWSEKGLELVQLATGWRFQSRLKMREYLDRLSFDKPPKYSRAVMETLAIIAYRQPVTRGEIEEIRGVTVSSPVIRQLEERNWIEVIGHKDTVGRPALFATTKQFLDDMAIPSLQFLPSIEEGAKMEDVFQQVINFDDIPSELSESSGEHNLEMSEPKLESDLKIDTSEPQIDPHTDTFDLGDDPTEIKNNG